jgi:hypothetical protein
MSAGMSCAKFLLEELIIDNEATMRLSVALLLIASCALPAKEPASARHIIVYKEPGRYAGWPANHGIWQWGNEILVGFEIGHIKSSSQYHAIDYEHPEEHVLARSTDGGATWIIEKPESLRPAPGTRIAGVPAEPGGKPISDFTGRMDFKKPGFAMTFRMESFHVGPSRFYYTEDKGKSWNGPFRVSDFDTPGTAARTDYLIDGKHEATVFLTAAKSNKREGRLLCARTTDGGRTFNFVSWVAPEAEGFAIMPSSVRLSPKTILTSLRRNAPAGNQIELHRSDDNGATWHLVSVVTPAASAKSSNPPSMIRLKDGRLCVTYGYRLPPYGIKARISSDEGKTWGDEISLRTGAGNHDLGYPRTVQRTDGKIVTVYYYNDKPDGERYIAATIWEP